MYFSFLFLQRIYRLGFLFVGILFILDLITFFYYPQTIFGDIFLATREQTPLTWVSALTLFAVAIACFFIYFKTKKSIWFFLSVVFLFFSMDDAIYFHERFSGYLANNVDFFIGFPIYIWAFLYSPLLIFAIGTLIYLLWQKASNKDKIIIMIILTMLMTTFCLDFIDGVIQKDATIVLCINEFYNKSVIHLMRLVEEILEVLAIGSLGYVILKNNCTK